MSRQVRGCATTVEGSTPQWSNQLPRPDPPTPIRRALAAGRPTSFTTLMSALVTAPLSRTARIRGFSVGKTDLLVV